MCVIGCDVHVVSALDKAKARVGAVMASVLNGGRVYGVVRDPGYGLVKSSVRAAAGRCRGLAPRLWSEYRPYCQY